MSLFVILLIVLPFVIAFPYLKSWLRRRMHRFILRRMSSAFGFPPPPQSGPRRESRRNPRKKSGWQAPPRQPRHKDGKIIPPEYAEDVDFVEIKEFDSETRVEQQPGGVKIVVEEQVTDAEYTIIRETKDADTQK